MASHPDLQSLRYYASGVRVIVNFQCRKGWSIHMMAEDCRTSLGPYGDVPSEATLIPLFLDLEAREDAMQGAVRDLQLLSRGGVHIDVPEDRLSLLGVSPVRNAASYETGIRYTPATLRGFSRSLHSVLVTNISPGRIKYGFLQSSYVADTRSLST